MLGWSECLQVLFDLFHGGDLGTLASLVVTLGGSMAATVRLIETELTAEEALCYARILHDLGDPVRADALAHEALAAALDRRSAPAA